MAGTLLVTGATGYVGSCLAARYLATTTGRVVLWAHAADAAEASNRRGALAERFAPVLNRVTFAFGDLAAEPGFDRIDRASITEIVHAAAITRFNVEAEVADVVNRAGAERVFAFAATCPRLRHFAYLSTVYSTGLRSGTIAEALPREEPDFANHYEASKHRAERALVECYDHLPWSILRLATIIADDEAGSVTQVNAFHNTLRLIRYGLLPLLPSLPEAPLYFVTGDFVVRSILKILQQEPRNQVWHLCHSREEMPTVQQLLDIAFDTFAEEEEFRSRRLLKPPYTDYPTFKSLIAGLDGMASRVTVQALRSVAPFAPQLYLCKNFVNDRVKALNGAAAPNKTALLAAACRSLVGRRCERRQ
jgi:thioester reductase-like protein